MRLSTFRWPLHLTAETLLAALEGRPIDAITVKTRARRKALLIADMDSTMIEGETLDELAGFAGVGEQISAITRRAMNGEIDFKEALRERVGMLRGLPLDALEKTWQRVRLTPGGRELVATMRARGALTALVSGGFSFFTGKVAAELGFDTHRSNTLLDDGRALTGSGGGAYSGSRQQAGRRCKNWRRGVGSSWVRRLRSATAPMTWR